jgi:hypothetical protein
MRWTACSAMIGCSPYPPNKVLQGVHEMYPTTRPPHKVSPCFEPEIDKVGKVVKVNSLKVQNKGFGVYFSASLVGTVARRLHYHRILKFERNPRHCKVGKLEVTKHTSIVIGRVLLAETKQ